MKKQKTRADADKLDSQNLAKALVPSKSHSSPKASPADKECQLESLAVTQEQSESKADGAVLALCSFNEPIYLSQDELLLLRLSDEKGNIVLPDASVTKRKRGQGQGGDEYYLVNKDKTQTRVKTNKAWFSQRYREEKKRQLAPIPAPPASASIVDELRLSSINKPIYLSQDELLHLGLSDEKGNIVLPDASVTKRKRGRGGDEYYLVNKDNTQTRVKTDEAWFSQRYREEKKRQFAILSTSSSSLVSSEVHSSPTPEPSCEKGFHVDTLSYDYSFSLLGEHMLSQYLRNMSEEEAEAIENAANGLLSQLPTEGYSLAGSAASESVEIAPAVATIMHPVKRSHADVLSDEPRGNAAILATLGTFKSPKFSKQAPMDEGSGCENIFEDIAVQDLF
ncbi:MAG: hypothetical protein H0U75_02435 [Legionella sp.]|nr:hypothetical protein [Legionella sp.]